MRDFVTDINNATEELLKLNLEVLTQDTFNLLVVYFNDLLVGKEKEIAELKEEIEELKKPLEENKMAPLLEIVRSEVFPEQLEHPSKNATNTGSRKRAHPKLFEASEPKVKSSNVSTDVIDGKKHNNRKTNSSRSFSKVNSSVTRKLVNTGNSCFLNSTMQALSSCHSFALRCEQLYCLVRKNIDYFDNEASHSEVLCRKYRVLIDFLKIMAALTKRSNSSKTQPEIIEANLQTFRELIGMIRNDFANKNQQDAHEFLLMLFEAIDDVAEYKADNEGDDVKEAKQLNPIEAFKFNVETCYVCKGCSKEEVRVDVRNDLAVHMRDNLSVQELLSSSFSTWTPIEKKCSSCNHQHAILSERITRFPECLVINLERYQLEGPQFSTKKINCSLEPSFELDISSLQKFPEIEKNGLEQSEKQQDSQYGQLLDRMKSCEIIKCCETKNIIMEEKHDKYSLVAAICHLGETPTNGHYIAYTREDTENSWLYCSDDLIRPATRSEISLSIRTSGYILFYEYE
nr:hypothetical protein C04E6.5 - Caenorhabditis elegans [Caenorhabditis elegans]